MSRLIIRFQILLAFLAMFAGALAGLGLAMEAIHLTDPAETWAQPEHKALPSRPVDELTNWGQGHAPAANVCPPGTFRFETDEGLFLECYRANAE